MNGSTLFDPIDRTDDRPGLYGERTFDFLNRVARPYWADVRWTLEQWLSHVPSGPHHADLRARLRSDDHEHRAALVELFVHELLLQGGYDIEIHPVLAHSNRRPDFLATRGGQSVYLEVATWGSRPEVRASTARENDLLRAVEQCHSPDFFLWVGKVQQGDTPPRGSNARRTIERWLAGLDPDAPALRKAHSFTELPGMTWRDRGWSMEVQAIPVSPEHRGRPDHRPIGIRGDLSASFVDDAPGLRRILDGKVHDYGVLNAPFVIVLGSWIWDPDQTHFMNCLYGHELFRLAEKADGTTSWVPSRDPSGFFISRKGWHNQHVAGVLHINQLSEGMLLKPNVDLWLHPDPHRPVEETAFSSLPVRVRRVMDGSIQTQQPTVTVARHLGLPDEWPRGDPWPKS